MADKKIVYLLGAGASYNALPLVKSFGKRFESFCEHLKAFTKRYKGDPALGKIKADSKKLIEAINNHYSIDTYAKKLFLKNDNLEESEEYNILINYLSSFFLYEQLKIDINKEENSFLKNKFDAPVLEAREKDKSILLDLDPRYDAFLAGILQKGGKGVELPENFSIVSWNYDFQVEKAYMNFTDENFNSTLNSLCIAGSLHTPTVNKRNHPFLIKLNGTASFLKSKSIAELFDFKLHELNRDTLDIIQRLLTQERNEERNDLRFAWIKSNEANDAIKAARDKISEAELVVVIGYSFPYFNREVDRLIFKNIHYGKGSSKVYIQSHPRDIESIKNRFKGVCDKEPELFIETDQFLIPNEL